MGESPQIAQLTSTAIATIGFQMISIGTEKFREILSRRPSKELIQSPLIDKRWSHTKTNAPKSTENTPTSPSSCLPEFTLEDVSYHDTHFDCWVIIYDHVYDITTFLHEHPGGDEIMLEYAGRDATLAFRSVGHSKFAEESLRQYRVGILVPEDRIWTQFYNRVS